MRAALALLVLAGLGCSEPKAKSPRNECRQDVDCPDGAHCDRSRNQCIAAKTETPYTIVLQASTPSAAEGEVSRHTFPSLELRASNSTLNLSIPPGASIRGVVGARDTSDANSKILPIKAQLVFVPISGQPGLPLAAVTVGSQSELNRNNENFAVTLTPSGSYEVTIFPLGPASTRFPPLFVTLSEADTIEGGTLPFVYPSEKLEEFAGILVDEKGAPLTGRWVRIVEAQPPFRVMSSIGVVGAKGELKLYVNEGVLAAGDYKFEIDLDNQNAWTTVLEADPEHIDANKENTITVPVVPRYVRFQGTVAKSSEVANLASTDLTFVSEFPIPSVLGDVRGRDFCRATLPSTKPPFRCRSNRQGTTDAEGRFSVALLPGEYQVFLSPTREGENVDRATTRVESAVIETQLGDLPQLGQLYMLTTGARYEGGVRATDLQALDNVLVRAIALGLRGSLEEIATYNRTSETVTDDSGAFELPVDVGYYDLVARPSAAIGFPWVYVTNRAIKVQKAPIPISGFVLPIPLLLAGVLSREGQPLAAASVDAYALVPALGEGKRAVLVGQTTTDAEGRYSLLLASKVSNTDDPRQPMDGSSE